MAEKNITKQAVKDIQITAIHGDLTFSGRDVYLWVKLPASHYEFKKDSEREEIAGGYSLALANLLVSEENEVECQLIVTSGLFDHEAWEKTLLEKTTRNNPPAYSSTYFAMMKERLRIAQFRTKAVFLGVKVGIRKDYNPNQVTNTAFTIPGMDKLVKLFSGEVDEYLTDAELEFWEDRARLIRLSLTESGLKAEQVFSPELAYIIRKQFFPSMIAPSIEELSLSDPNAWGKGEISSLADSEVYNTSQWLKMEQETAHGSEVGYRATLCFSKFPASMNFPEKEPWIHFSSLLDFPTEFYSRFTIEPSRKVKKQITNKIKEIEDQAENMTSAGGSINMELEENYQIGKHLEFALSKDDTPWLFARHRIIVEAKTETELKERCRKVMDHYKSLGITVVWPRGDQLSLLLEGLPNDRIRSQSYYQRHDLNIIGAGVPTGAGGVGDKAIRTRDGEIKGWTGTYLGYTISRSLEPVFLSPNVAIAKNRPPTTVFTGSPGTGKSASAMSLAYSSVQSGSWTAFLDPKGDSAEMLSLPGCEDGVLIDLQEGFAGLLDPFSMSSNPAEQKELVQEVIALFVGGVDKIQSEQFSELARGITIIARRRNPSMSDLVDYMMESENHEAKALGDRLDLVRSLPFARLCFAPANSGVREALRPDRSLTIITMLGLKLPGSTTPQAGYTNSNRLAVAIMYLLTFFMTQYMTNTPKSQPKAIYIDEAWAITSTSQGAKLITDVSRLGRSMNTALILISQNAKDFLGEEVTNSVSTRVAFGTKNPDEIKNILRFFSLDPDSVGNQDVVRNLDNGECLIKDCDDRIARVYVERWNQHVLDASETNPYKNVSEEDLETA